MARRLGAALLWAAAVAAVAVLAAATPTLEDALVDHALDDAAPHATHRHLRTLRGLRGLNATRAANGGPHYILPTTAIPYAYRLTLTLNLDQGTFSGDEYIRLIAVREVKFIKLHVNTDVITIKTAVVSGSSDAVPKVTAWEADRELQTVTLWLDTALSLKWDFNLQITYDAKLRDDMYGFYKSSYKDSAGKNVYLAATQFEPSYARSAFPCWDEPQYKARFTVTIKHDPSLQALSNTAGTPTPPTTTDTMTTTTFAQTPPMSTYLVAFVVSNFNSTAANDTVNIKNIPYNVWVRPEQVEQAVYAAQVGPKSLEQLAKFTDVEYALPKLDLVAIPDFSAGAMENWGLITYRETALMFTEGASTEASRESIALVIAHEQAHMWFGDLVSPGWWGYVWLNEGFARYMQYVAMDLVEPTWNLMDTFVVKTLQGALAFDALASSHPLSATVYTPDDIQGIFDRISYDKGASVLHMTRNVLGADNFKSAITTYLQNMSYSVAYPHDLFEHFNDVGDKADFKLPNGVTVGTVLETWTQEAGYPLVTIQTASDGTTATVTQTRFLSSKDQQQASSKVRWWVPLTYAVQDGSFDQPQRLWLNPSDNSTQITGLKGWIIGNVKQTGFYRVNYDDQNWAALATYLQDPAKLTLVPALNRAQLLDDALSLARAGLLSYSRALDMTRFLAHDKDPIPWTSALSQIAFLRRVVASGDENVRASFKTYVLGLMDAVFEDVGFQVQPSDAHLRLIFRSTLLSAACGLGHAACVGNATAKFAAWKTGTKVEPDLQSAVYCTGLSTSSSVAGDWAALWKLYEQSTNPGERTILLSALGCTADSATLNAYLLKSLDKSAIRAQDASAVFSAVLAGGEANVDVAFKFFKDKFSEMITSYGGWSAMQTVIEGLASGMPNEQRLQELEDFLTSNSDKLGVARAAAVRALESARANLAWRSTHLRSVADWLQGRGYSSGARGGPALGPATGSATLGTALCLGLALAVTWQSRTRR